MHLLDTSFLVDYLLEKPGFIAKFKELAEKGLYISAITSAEILSGAEEHQINSLNSFLDSLIVIPVTDSLARKAGITRAELKRKGQKKPLPDILIGQTAIEYNLILVTGNPKDFPQLAARKLLMRYSG